MNVCYSGGAIGADTEFTNAAIAAGHRVINHSFYGHNTLVPKNTIKILTAYELLAGEETVRNAAKYLKKNWNAYLGKSRNLILRNFWQVSKYTNMVYAVANIKKDGRVSGGTGWAVTMAIQHGVPDIYTFSEGSWSRWFGTTDPTKGHWGKSLPPKPYGQYTGIGSRFIGERETKAIWELYEIE
jgi:hypothetical protein